MEEKADPSLVIAPLAKCAHAMCTCTVGADEQYCSDYCATAANAGTDEAEGACTCGHSECKASAVQS